MKDKKEKQICKIFSLVTKMSERQLEIYSAFGEGMTYREPEQKKADNTKVLNEPEHFSN